MKHKTDIVTLILIAVLFFALSAINIAQPNRPVESQAENRALAAMPKFSLPSLLDGSYFAGIDAFVSDTFIFREAMIGASEKIETLYGMENDEIAFIAVDTEREDDIEIYIPPIVTEPVTERETEAEPFTEPETEVETEPEIITEAETELETETEADTVTETEAATEAETKAPIDEIIISKEKMFIPVSGYDYISASVLPSDAENITVSWTISDGSIVKIEAANDRLKITGLKEGETVLTASSCGLSASCTVKVSVAITPDGEGNSTQIITEEPEILTSGLVIYKDAVYSIPYLVERSAKYYAQTVGYYASLFPKATISTVIAPLSSATLELDTFGRGRLTDQNNIIESVASYMQEGINSVNIFDAIWEHRNEYLYFKSDHHWTQRGAYYAYSEFAKSVGFEPTPLSDFEERLLTDSFQGTMYSYTGDERVKRIYDSLYAYMPRKVNTMTIYSGGGSVEYDNCILAQYKNYGCFIAADNAYTIINVPENPQDVNILVLKDSYGNAMIPFLTEHYGNIIVVDPRHVTFNIYDLLKDYMLRDLLFLNNIYNPNVASWSMNLLRAVGVEN